MEEAKCAITIEEALSEINLYLAQFLGSDLAETLRNIANLSQVDTYFNTLVTQNSKNIGAMLRARFDNGRLAVLSDLILNKKLTSIIKLLEMNIIDLSEVLDLAILEVNKGFINNNIEKVKDITEVIDQLYELKVLKDEPSITIDGRFITPLDYILSSGFMGTGSPESVVMSMIEKKRADANQLVGPEQVTPLYKALMVRDFSFFNRLLEYSDPNKKNKDGSSVMQYIKENPNAKGLEMFKLALSVDGFSIVMRENKTRRGRKFTVQRKKIHHHGRLMAKNAQKNNHHVV